MVIGVQALAFRRIVRDNEFWAFGSGEVDHDVTMIDTQCITITLELVCKLKSQSIAFYFMRR